ncbi:MAG: hypothetical protein LBK52_06810 [Deltaproteobacteria bacterium]|jgi:hypothetical protein|nr:hypothetical protein [Deltaproteobacteria bacterium]
MKYFIGLLGLLGLVWGLASPALAQGQGQGQQGDFQFEELDFDRQGRQGQGGQPSQDDPDGLLTRMFSGEEVPPGSNPGQPQGANQGQPPRQSQPGQDPGSGPIQNLPGEPSPVQNPAGPGEARIERSQQQQASPSGRRYYRSSRQRRVQPFQRPWQEAEKAWAKDIGNHVVPCYSLVSNRVLYHINCAQNLRVQPYVSSYRGEPRQPYSR